MNRPVWDHDIAVALHNGLSQPDDVLGELFIRLYAVVVASKHDLSIDDALTGIVALASEIDVTDPRMVVWEKAIKKAASGDMTAAGRMVREAMCNGAGALSVESIAQRYVPIGIRQSERTKAFVADGIRAQKSTAAANRVAVHSAAQEVMAGWPNSRCPSSHELAERVGKMAGVSARTARRFMDEKGALKAIFANRHVLGQTARIGQRD
jgi:hypothetical protein